MTTSESAPRTVGALLSRIGGLWLAYLKGQLLVALAMGAAIWVISSAIGLSWALLIGLVAGLLQTVPQIGGLLAVVPAAIVALWQGSSVLPVENWVFMLIVIGVFLLVQQVSNLVVEPRLVGSRLNLPPLAVLLAVLIGTLVANVAGAYLAVPVLVAGREIVAYLRHRKQPPAGLAG